MKLTTWIGYLRSFGLTELIRLERMRRAPRFREERWMFLGRPLRVVDAASAYSSLRSIFLDGEYAFRAASDSPRIVDVGANIGASVIFFKRQHPHSKVIAFEADPRIFDALRDNVAHYGFSNVTLVNKAVWIHDGEVDFAADGADGGTMARSAPTRTVKVTATRLRPYLEEPVDLLKIDIEGAETEVLEDCGDLLRNVHRLFVEYHSFADRPQSLHRLLAVLSSAGFRVTISPASPVSASPFLEPWRSAGMDLQLNIYAVREQA
jgi:FkbM family methyltransferase